MALRHYRNVPNYGGDWQQMVAKFNEASFQDVSVMIFGDSIKTNNAAGQNFIDSLNLLARKRFGPPEKGPWAPCISFNGDFFMYGGAVAQTIGAIDSTEEPPLFPGRETSGLNYGVAHRLYAEGEEAENLYREGENFQRQPSEGSFRYQALLRKSTAGPVDARIKILKHAPQAGVNLFGTLDSTTSFTGLALDADDTTYVIVESDPIVFDPALPETTVITQGSNDGGASPVIGLRQIAGRFVQETVRGGLNFTSISEGGYTATTLLSSHGGCGPVLNAMAPTMSLIWYGTNDIGNNVSPTQFVANVETLINTLRSAAWLNDPDHFFVLIPPGETSRTDPTQRAYHEQYPDALRRLSEKTANTAFVNFPRAMSAKFDQLDALADGIHYKNSYKRLVAEETIKLLFGGEPKHLEG